MDQLALAAGRLFRQGTSDLELLARSENSFRSGGSRHAGVVVSRTPGADPAALPEPVRRSGLLFAEMGIHPLPLVIAGQRAEGANFPKFNRSLTRGLGLAPEQRFVL